MQGESRICTARDLRIITPAGDARAHGIFRPLRETDGAGVCGRPKRRTAGPLSPSRDQLRCVIRARSLTGNPSVGLQRCPEKQMSQFPAFAHNPARAVPAPLAGGTPPSPPVEGRTMNLPEQERWLRVKARMRAEVGEEIFKSWFAAMDLVARRRRHRAPVGADPLPEELGAVALRRQAARLPGRRSFPRSAASI